MRGATDVYCAARTSYRAVRFAYQELTPTVYHLTSGLMGWCVMHVGNGLPGCILPQKYGCQCHASMQSQSMSTK